MRGKTGGDKRHKKIKNLRWATGLLIRERGREWAGDRGKTGRLTAVIKNRSTEK